MLITKLQKSGVMEILLYLKKNSKASRSDLRDNIDVVLTTLYKTSLPTLKEACLIHEETTKKFPYSVYIGLTEKGRRIAEKLVEIEAILEERS